MSETSQALELFDSGFSLLCEELTRGGLESVSIQVGSGKLPLAVISLSGTLAGQVAELDSLSGDGPRTHCLATGEAVHVIVGDAATSDRWPGFSAATAGLGASHIWAVPVGVGSSILAIIVAATAEATVDVGRIASLCEHVAANAVNYLLASSRATCARADLSATAHLDTTAASVHRTVGFLAARLDLSIDDAGALFRAMALSSGATAAEMADQISLDPRSAFSGTE